MLQINRTQCEKQKDLKEHFMLLLYRRAKAINHNQILLLHQRPITDYYIKYQKKITTWYYCYVIPTSSCLKIQKRMSRPTRNCATSLHRHMQSRNESLATAVSETTDWTWKMWERLTYDIKSMVYQDGGVWECSFPPWDYWASVFLKVTLHL